MTSPLGERIKLILREQGLRQVELAQALGVSANYIYLLTSGRKQAVSPTLAKLIENTYGYSASWVLTGAAPPPASSDLQAHTIQKVKRMDLRELEAVAAFICSLEKDC